MALYHKTVYESTFLLFEDEFMRKRSCVNRVGQFYLFLRVKMIPTIAPIKIIGANLINSHSNT